MLARNARNSFRRMLRNTVFTLAVNLTLGAFAEEPAGAPSETKPAILRGVIRNEDEGPLIGVRVRVAIPATDMRFLGIQDTLMGSKATSVKILETKTVKNGEYRFEIPGLTQPTKISIDAMRPGYRRITGMLMKGGDPNEFVVSPGESLGAPFTLHPSLYVSFDVVDEQGRPIPKAIVSANANTARSSFGVERTTSNLDGHVELFNYEMTPFIEGVGETKGRIFIEHPDYLSHTIDDVYNIPENERRRIQVVLRAGTRAAGQVVDAAGIPVENAMVKIEGGERKACLTDATGRFDLKGLADDQQLTISVLAKEIDQKTSMKANLNQDLSNLKLQLEPIELPKTPKIYTVLGMQLTDLSPDYRTGYNLFIPAGALILNPGTDSERLKIGNLEKTFVFWCVGNTDVSSVKQFVSQILKEVGDSDSDEHFIRVVYSLSIVDFDGTNTQYVKLTKNDIAHLKAVQAEIEKE
ncbi:carboxypeptidase-like regulatory domain-containing protein [Schlesneria paludicola]|uniref:carboxypeptidase-like regulatory domain-containing protein n=1 Tax=Schlesneria paludicola TaxID=360056 RepID=UPI000492A94F|nr:carboxypeptidase-like regulatory domain-containing protein [Schlesneria paludicola]